MPLLPQVPDKSGRGPISSAGILLLLFLVINGAWLGKDRLVRDGDEEGHVGAAELFLSDLSQGQWGQAIHRATVANMGDYPSLYPAVVGTWWWLQGGELPGRPAVRWVNLGFLLLAGAGLVWAARGVGWGPALLGGAAILHIPLFSGIGRHFMPEGALAAAVALAVAAAVRQRERPGRISALLLGVALAAGWLTKQTFPIYVILPLLFLLRPHRSLLFALPGLALALPWTLGNLDHQLEYSGASVAYAGSASWMAHLAYYPRSLSGFALGPVWLLLVGILAWSGWHSRFRRHVILGLVWAGGGLLLLMLVPKKYDRLLTPLLPGLGLWLAAGVAARPKLSVLPLLGAAWTAWLSFGPSGWSQPPQPLEDFQPGCVQVWLRPPVSDDLGFSAVSEAAAQAEYGAVVVLDPPSIPCSVQTTFDWDYHLSPYLRRSGVDRPVERSGSGTLVVDFSASPETAGVHQIPLLSARFAIRTGP